MIKGNFVEQWELTTKLETIASFDGKQMLDTKNKHFLMITS